MRPWGWTLNPLDYLSNAAHGVSGGRIGSDVDLNTNISHKGGERDPWGPKVAGVKENCILDRYLNLCYNERMYKTMRASLKKWNETKNERTKMQHAYLAISIVTVLTAGLLSLLNYDMGQQLTNIAMLALGMFFVNLIFWTLLDGLFLSNLDQRSSSKDTTSTRKK